jgi:hypothetical protein
MKDREEEDGGGSSFYGSESRGGCVTENLARYRD